MNTELKEWTIHYVKNKDLSQRKLVKIEEKNDFLNVEYKDKKVKHYIIEKLDEKILPAISNNDFKSIVCLNIEENFKFLVKSWKKLSDIRNLSIIFVNMKTHDKWLINPHVHSMVADPATIEQGLRTMFDTANGIIAEVKGKKSKMSIFETNSEEDSDEEEIE